MPGALLLLAMPLQIAAAEPDRAAAAALAARINAYRQEHGLPAIPMSPSLTKVAEAHVLDMAAAPDGGSSPDRGSDSRGIACNAHSWSARGSWTPVCYTADHRYADAMWSKPREITGGAYAGNGYEIGYWSSGAAGADGALASWQSSSAHNAVVVETGTWKDARWQAMGVAIYGHFAFAWFGKERDVAPR